MADKTKIILINNVTNTRKISISLPMSIHSDFEDRYVIEKRKKGGKLLKKDFIIQVINKGIKHI